MILVLVIVIVVFLTSFYFFTHFFKRSLNIFKIFALIMAAGLIFFGFFIWNWMRPMLSFDNSKIPYGLVTANPVEFDKIYAISKFRSAAGHDYSNTWDGETCRSMKHYFNIGRSEPGTTMPVRSYSTADSPNIKIFAPFDGTISSIESEQTPIGKQVHIRSKNFPSFSVRLFHIDLLPNLGTGSEVKSGEQVGTIGPKDGTDVSVEGIVLFKGSVDLSVFELMTDQAFAPYAGAGFKKDDFIISRKYRDEHPLKCGGGHNNEEFIRDPGYDFFSDFVFLKPDPFPQGDEKPVKVGPPTR